jgi:hypothetical protein
MHKELIKFSAMILIAVLGKADEINVKILNIEHIRVYEVETESLEIIVRR